MYADLRIIIIIIRGGFKHILNIIVSFTEALFDAAKSVNMTLAIFLGCQE